VEVHGVLPAAIVLPPAAQGDVYRVCQQRPWAIGLIDGYFERVPAVWHKELLWALSQGVHCFGAASMGALRAAELAPYGMVGVGSIYQAYASGALERDDEVAVVHNDAERGFAATSVALVDVRATLARAVRSGVLDRSGSLRFIETASRTFYADRSWDELFRRAQEAAVLDSGCLEALRRWVSVHAVSQKKIDALAMLEAMRDLASNGAQPFKPQFRFEHTEFWRLACAREGRQPLARGAMPAEAVLDELRLIGPERYRLTAQAGLARALALAEADRLRLARTEGLATRSWPRRSASATAALVNSPELEERETRIQALQHRLLGQVGPHILDHLQLQGELAELSQRAAAKRRRLPDAEVSPASLGLDRDALLRWFYQQRLGTSVPADLEAAAEELGLPSADVWVQVLSLEYAFCFGVAEQRGEP
jgi:hypothetical protein